MKNKKQRLIKHYIIISILCLLTVLFIMLEQKFTVRYHPSAAFLQQPIEAPYLNITFDFTPQPVLGSNQVAIWVENAQGELIRTLAVTQYTATRGWRLRKSSLPLWVKTQSPQDLSIAAIDAISAATPRQQRTYSVVWDYTDELGNIVPEGEYSILIEGTLYFTDHVVFRTNLNTTTLSPTIETRNGSSRHANMIANVQVQKVTV